MSSDALWLVAIITFLAGNILAGIILVRENARVKRDAFDAGFVRGMCRAAENHAEWIEVHHHILCNGYAFQCDGCGNIQECLMPPGYEYCTCQKCGFRMPMPLYRGKGVSHV